MVPPRSRRTPSAASEDGASAANDDATSSTNSSGWSSSTSVIVAANRLPVRVTRGAGGQWTVEWAGDRVIEAQNALSHHELARPAGVKFVGRVAEIAVPPDEQHALARELQAFNCFPVFVSAPEAKLYYEDYCKQTLWPTFHNVVDVYSPVDVVLDANGEQRGAAVWNPDSQKLAWQAYANVNQLFAQVPRPSTSRVARVPSSRLQQLVAHTFASTLVLYACIGGVVVVVIETT